MTKSKPPIVRVYCRQISTNTIYNKTDDNTDDRPAAVEKVLLHAKRYRYYSKNSEKIAAAKRPEYLQSPNPWRNQVRKRLQNSLCCRTRALHGYIVAIRLCFAEVRGTAVGG